MPYFGSDQAVWRDGDWSCEKRGWWMLNERKCCGRLVLRMKDLAFYDPSVSIKDDSFFLQESSLLRN